MSKKYSKIGRRKVVSSALGLAASGVVGSSAAAADSSGGPEDFAETLKDMESQLGELVSIDAEDTGDGFVVWLTFAEGATRTARVQRIGSDRIRVIVRGKKFVLPTEVDGPRRRIKKPQTFGEEPGLSTSSTSASLDPGETTFIGSASEYKFQQAGGSIGNKVTDYDLSKFEIEVGISAYAIGYRAVTGDVYTDISVGAGASQLEVEYDYDYKWSNGTLGSAATAVEGTFLIRDLDRGENLSIQELFESSGSFAKLRSGSDTGNNVTTAALNGGGNYRIGIRAFTQVDAYIYGFSSADISRSGSSDDYFDVSNLLVSVE